MYSCLRHLFLSRRAVLGQNELLNGAVLTLIVVSLTLQDKVHRCILVHCSTRRQVSDGLTSKLLTDIFKAEVACFLLPVTSTLLYLLRMRGRKRAISVLGEAAAWPLKRWKTNSVPSSVFITDTSRIGYWAPRFITNESLTAPRIKAITHWVPESATKSFPALEIYFSPLASDSNAAEHLPECLTEWRSAANSFVFLM